MNLCEVSMVRMMTVFYSKLAAGAKLPHVTMVSCGGGSGHELSPRNLSCEVATCGARFLPACCTSRLRVKLRGDTSWPLPPPQQGTFCGMWQFCACGTYVDLELRKRYGITLQITSDDKRASIYYLIKPLPKLASLWIRLINPKNNTDSEHKGEPKQNYA